MQGVISSEAKSDLAKPRDLFNNRTMKHIQVKKILRKVKEISPLRLRKAQAPVEMTRQNSAGFTLIEILAVSVLSTILLVTATSLLLTYSYSSVKNKATRYVKNEGSYVLNSMSSLLRNARQLTTNTDSQVCQSGMNKIAFVSPDGEVTEYFLETDPTDNKLKIASNSGIYLTSGSFEIIDDSLSFDCVTNADNSLKHISISFGLRKGSQEEEARELTEQYFTTGVTLRN